jgi:chaperonin GroES
MAKKDFNLKPLEDRIVVKPGDEEEMTVSGIVIPDTAKEKPQEGSVVAVGPGRFEEGQRVPLDVAVGDTVIYSKYGGTEVKVEGDEYLILSARDVLAVVAKKDAAQDVRTRGRAATRPPPESVTEEVRWQASS